MTAHQAGHIREYTKFCQICTHFSVLSLRNISSVMATLNGWDIRTVWGFGEIWTPTTRLECSRLQITTANNIKRPKTKAFDTGFAVTPLQNLDLSEEIFKAKIIRGKVNK